MTWFPKSTLENGWGLQVDLSRAVPNEKFECLTCQRTGALTTQGRCGFCNSDSVIPEAVLQ